MGLASRWNVWRDRNQRDSRPQKKRSRTSLFRILDTFRQFRPAPTYDTRENNARLRVASIQSREKKCQTRKISLTTVTFLLELNTRRIYSHIREKRWRETAEKRDLFSLSWQIPPKPRNATLVKKTLFLSLPLASPFSIESREGSSRRHEHKTGARARARTQRTGSPYVLISRWHRRNSVYTDTGHFLALAAASPIETRREGERERD